METGDRGIGFLETWTRAIRKSRESLESDDRKSVERYKSWDDLQRILLDSNLSSISPTTLALNSLKAFFTFFQTKLGEYLDTDFLWGTLTHLLQLVDMDSDKLGKVLYMVKSLDRKAELFIHYCKDVQVVGNSIKEICYDMQVLFLDFLTNAINYIHADGDIPRKRSNSLYRRETGTPLELIQGCYEKTDKEINALLKHVEIVTGNKAPTSGQPIHPIDTNRVLMLPPTKTDRFFDRDGVFKSLDDFLGIPGGEDSFLSVALYGMSGIGKSTAASTYIEKRFSKKYYDVILWVYGENSASLRQSFTRIAIRLKLPGVQLHAHDENLDLVQDWLQSTGCKWLIVYDNVESIDALAPYLPGSSQGKVIFTTNNRSVAFKLSSHRLEVAPWDTKMGSEFLLFLLKDNIGKNVEAETVSASILSQKLHGHPLRISQIAALIDKGQYSIREFLLLYVEDVNRMHSLDGLNRVLELSFKKLGKDSLSLLGMMSFLKPNMIPQKLFEIDSDRVSSDDLAFCSNNIHRYSALTELITLSLVKKDRDTLVLSVHGIVQTQFKSFLSPEQRQKAFNNTVVLLYNALPKENTVKGQLYEDWEVYNKYLLHVLSLKDFFEEEMKRNKSFKVPWEFCKLLVQYERYLYETNYLVELQSLCDVNLDAVATFEDEPRKHNLRATILSHLANLAESRGNTKIAIDLNHQVYRIRLEERPLDQNLLCQVANNLGYCYNSANDHSVALEWFNKSWEWWEKSNENENDYLLGNMARCMLYLNDFEKAREMLDTTISQLEHPTPSNWAMLAYAYFVLGSLERCQHNFKLAEEHFTKAQQSWLKGDPKHFHPFNGGCMYKIGVCCLDQGKVQTAIQHIEESIKVTNFYRNDMPVEHARNLFKMSEALLQDNQAGSQEKAKTYRMEAETYLKMKKTDIITVDTEDAYDKLVPVFWR